MKIAIVNDELLKVVNVVKANSLSDVLDGVMAESWMAPNAGYTIESGVRTPIPVSPLTDEEKIEKYNSLVVSKIKVNYSQDDEFAMMAEGIADATNALYVAYRAFVATCKAEANTEVYGS